MIRATCLLILAVAAPIHSQVSGERLLSQAAAQDDFPSLCASSSLVCVAWIESYLEKQVDRVVARVRSKRTWGELEVVDGTPGRRYRTALAIDRKGQPVLVWSAETKSGWQLMMSRRTDKWTKPLALTSSYGPHIHPRLAAGANGRVWLAWQQFSGRNSDIYLAEVAEDGLKNVQQISQDPASDWDPDLAIDRQGRVHVAWDSYRSGDYDVYYRRREGNNLSPVLRLTSSPNFEAHASIACDGEGRLWVAWDDGGPRWGKDWPGNGGWKGGAWKSETLRDPAVAGKKGITTRMGGLHRVDGFHLARLTGNRLEKPAEDFQAGLSPIMKGATEFPRLALDSRRRLTVFFRFNPRTPFSASKRLGARPKRIWTAWARTLTRQGWTPPVPLPGSEGRNHHLTATVPSPDGSLLCTYATDGRTPEKPNGKSNNVRFAVYQASGEPADQFLDSPIGAARKNTHFLRPKPALWSIGGKTYHLYRGDLHRHTELSGDGSWDGSLLDFFRYGLDAAALDFIAITDHGYGSGEYSWWLAQKMTDVFWIPGEFVPIHGYERSMPRPNAHRNIFTLDRGFRAVPPFIDLDLKKKIPRKEWLRLKSKGKTVRPDDTLRMWNMIRKQDAISVPHTINNTDWKDNDPELEPLMEIYQGCRLSYEGPGAPKTSRKWAGGKGSAWEALGKGYRIGFIASSDHRSTHISYANLWATELTRPALFEAMHARRTFGSTDTLIARTEVAGNPSGTIIEISQAPTLVAHIEGTTSLKSVMVVKDGKVVYSVQPQKPKLDISFQDLDSKPGTAYYYVRAVQEDEQVAWVSPIWVTRK